MAHSTDAFGLSRRQLLSIGGGITAAGALTACGSNTGRADSSASASGGATSGEKVTLSQWYHQYGEEGTQQAVEKYAAAYTKATVKVEWKPGDYDKTTAASLLTDTGPDVFEYGNGPTIDMIKGKQVVDMTDTLGDAKSDFNEQIIKRYTFDGKVWAIPQLIDCILLVYRKSMLDAAGIKPPTTLDELVAAARALTKGDVKGLYLGNDGGAGLVGGNLLWGAGFEFLKEDGSFGFDDPKAGAALKTLNTLWSEKVTQMSQDPKDWWAADGFIAGQCAMAMTGLWTFPDIIKGLKDDFGVIPWPAGDGGKATVTMGAYGSCVSARSKNVDAAKEFAKWLWVDQTDSQVDFATAYGYHIPARKSLIGKAKTLQDGPGKDAADAAFAHGHAQTMMLWTPKCQTAFSDGMTRIVKEGADPMKEIATMKPVIEADVKRVLG